MSDRDLIARLAHALRVQLDGVDLYSELLAEAAARALLAEAQPEPVEPTDEEWDALKERLWDHYETRGYQGERFMYEGDFGTALDLARQELLARWGRPAPVPVSVAERLPTAADCDAEGWCWMYEPDGVWWQVLIDAPCVMPEITHWLPHWALPVPLPTTEQ
jgi:hypothetical protein